MDSSENLIASIARSGTSSAIAKQIFKAEVPEEFVKELPEQTLYSVIKLNGLESSGELIELLNQEQIQHMLDFDIWEKDRFQEDRFFTWLSVCDSTQDLSILEHILHSVDLKLVAFLVSHYVDIHIQQEATDQPPDIGYISPDKGYTWLKLKGVNSDRDFLLGRLLAQVFENNAELFYQIIGVVQTSTPAVLEESAYQDKEKRLAALGIPDRELANKLHQSLVGKELEQHISSHLETRTISSVPIVQPLIYDSGLLQPLDGLLEELGTESTWQTELSHIMNAALVFWDIAFYETDLVNLLTAKVKGAINIGLETSIKENKSALTAYKELGIEGLYRRSLNNFYSLRKSALELSDAFLKELHPASVAFSLIAHLREPFPSITQRYVDLGPLQSPPENLEQDIIDQAVAISSLSQLVNIQEWLSSLKA